jgi:hypothetical protein
LLIDPTRQGSAELLEQLPLLFFEPLIEMNLKFSALIVEPDLHSVPKGIGNYLFKPGLPLSVADRVKSDFIS